jgi:type II secretory pathway component GspD/PulD (secretin)
MKKLVIAIFAATLSVFSVGSIGAQTAAATKAPADAPAAKPASDVTAARPNANMYPERTFFLINVIQPSDANEINTAIRNALPPDDKIYLLPSEEAIVIRANAEDMALAEKLIKDLDRPKKNYRLTYTVTELDGTKQIGIQHYAMIMTSNQQTSLKLGNKVPVATGSYSSGANGTNMSPVQTQFTYVDVGMNFEATLTGMGENAMLKSFVEQSSVAPEQSGVEPRNPILRSTSLKGESFLAPGKPLLLGSVDVPGSTSHLQIEIVMEPLP